LRALVDLVHRAIKQCVKHPGLGAEKIIWRGRTDLGPFGQCEHREIRPPGLPNLSRSCQEPDWASSLAASVFPTPIHCGRAPSAPVARTFREHARDRGPAAPSMRAWRKARMVAAPLDLRPRRPHPSQRRNRLDDSFPRPRARDVPIQRDIFANDCVQNFLRTRPRAAAPPRYGRASLPRAGGESEPRA
jgi:hypothetical protein